jgi:Na+/H+ antiporter NhaD/arsenite permease-like protein
MKTFFSILLFSLMSASPALAAEALDGAKLSLLWAIPFAGMLLSIALGPLLFADIWHHHYGKIAGFWAALIVVPMAVIYGGDATAHVVFHTAALEYVPFILMLTALFTAAGGLVLRGNLHGAPILNTGLLTLGTLLASVIGTTGASMVLMCMWSSFSFFLSRILAAR